MKATRYVYYQLAEIQCLKPYAYAHHSQRVSSAHGQRELSWLTVAAWLAVGLGLWICDVMQRARANPGVSPMLGK